MGRGSSCRVCGCTDDRACLGGCCWIEPDLCSTCATPKQIEAAIRRAERTFPGKGRTLPRKVRFLTRKRRLASRQHRDTPVRSSDSFATAGVVLGVFVGLLERFALSFDADRVLGSLSIEPTELAQVWTRNPTMSYVSTLRALRWLTARGLAVASVNERGAPTYAATPIGQARIAAMMRPVANTLGGTTT